MGGQVHEHHNYEADNVEGCQHKGDDQDSVGRVDVESTKVQRFFALLWHVQRVLCDPQVDE